MSSEARVNERVNALEAFVLANTRLCTAPLCPELPLYLLDPDAPLGHVLNDGLWAAEIPPPYWAFCWASGQAIARWLLDHPELVLGQRVLDVGAGCGVAAIAAARCGAREVTAADRQEHARAAISVNAQQHGAQISVIGEAPVHQPGWDVVLAGDVFYDARQARVFTPWFDRIVQAGGLVLAADPGRPDFPQQHARLLAHYEARTFPDLEAGDLQEVELFAWGDATENSK